MRSPSSFAVLLPPPSLPRMGPGSHSPFVHDPGQNHKLDFDPTCPGTLKAVRGEGASHTFPPADVSGVGGIRPYKTENTNSVLIPF